MTAREGDRVFQLNISNLQVTDVSFDVPSALGAWRFQRTTNYDAVLQHMESGMCAHTYIATNMNVNFQTRDADFVKACDEIIDICLVLSFSNARCVAPTGSTAWSQPQLLAGGGNFITPRAIFGFDQLATHSLTTLFSNWLIGSYIHYTQRNLRLQLTHWLSGLTCFSLEDIYLSAGVQMDVIKQVERAVSSKPKLTYFEGMQSASRRYGLTPLGHDYKNMRNDIVHEGRLSGSNFPNQSKNNCAEVISSTLNRIDLYVIRVLDFTNSVSNMPRWKGSRLNAGLPAFSIP